MSVLRRSFALRLAIALAALLAAAFVEAAEPLHVRIDRIIDLARVGPASPVAGDAEFLRRISLDLAGEIPSAAAARDFLADQAPDKREKLVDRLLAGPAYARNMVHVFSAMLMERRADKAIPAAQWHEYLRNSFATGKPYNQLAREILAADGVDPALRPAARFYLEREGEPNLLTRDVGRIFFGRDLQCAQCHDHPIIESYYQADYYGLFACLSRGVLFTDPKDKDKKVFFAEKGEGGTAFHSVFDPDAKGLARPRLPGAQQLVEPVFAAGDEYTVKPADGVRPVPKYSRRARLADEATSGGNRAFNENIANRLWTHLLGMGLVEPVDLHHVDNPPSHPELLALLTDEFVAMKFDVKALLREIALSQTYQRSIDLPEPQLAVADDGLAAQLPQLEAELQRLTTETDASAKAVEQVQSELKTSRTATVELASQSDKLTASLGELKKATETANQALAQAKAAHAAKHDASVAVSDAAHQIQAASEKLPGEKPLADAAAKFKQRADQLTAEAATASKTVADQTASAAAAADKLTKTQAEVQQLTGKQDAANTQVAGLEAKSAVAIATIQAQRASAKQIERRLKTVKSLLAYRQAQQVHNATQKALDDVKAKLAGAKQSLEKLAAESPAHNAAIEAANKEHAEATGALAEAQQQLDAKTAVAQTVSLAATKALAASQKLSGDAELTAAAQAVKARADQLTAEAAELQTLLAARRQSAEQAAGVVASARGALESALRDLDRLQKEVPSLEAQLPAIAAKFTGDQQKLSFAVDDLIPYENKQFATASLKPLTPEQLAASLMQATGVADQLRAAADGEINAKTPLTDAIRNDPAQMAARQKQIDDATFAKSQANTARFIELFGAGAGQPQSFFATADQALFFSNDGLLRGWLAPGGGNLTERLGKLDDPRALSLELYLSVLTRQPTENEIADTTAYLAGRTGDRAAAVQELVWALVSSLEFRFNH
ncbi:MAG TPA: DUF1549 domain-containing protein [Pirellulales bacterium]|nr:DUF1549 domain-containing protein [Pirellulales bacterium]